MMRDIVMVVLRLSVVWLSLNVRLARIRANGLNNRLRERGSRPPKTFVFDVRNGLLVGLHQIELRKRQPECAAPHRTPKPISPRGRAYACAHATHLTPMHVRRRWCSSWTYTIVRAATKRVGEVERGLCTKSPLPRGGDSR